MSKKKTIEETYVKLTQREHILHRSNMYIGDTKKSIEELWVFDNSKTEKSNIIKRMVEYSPGFLKIFDEVLTNALDHSNRDPTVDKIKLDYNKETGEISIYNTGTGIPVVEHKDYKMYVPEIIFGHLLSSSNYNDNDKRVGAGVNGLGIKLVSVYSLKLTVETIDSERGLKFVQTFTDNMQNRTKPKITKNSGKSYTKVTFLPDYKRFEMKGLEQDTIGLIEKRMYDCVACTNKNVSIFINGEKLKGKGMADYVKYFFDESGDNKMILESFENKVGGINFVWEMCVVPWDNYEQVSFVNGNSTYQGGKHVDHILYQITSKLKTLLETKKKIKDVRPAMIKDRIFLFLRATVVNPQFSSQTKEFLTTQPKDFGCKIDLSDKFIDKIWKSSIINDIVELCKVKESLELAKSTDGKKKNKVYIPKLEDALWAGTSKSQQCSLILTEGDSAKTFALWGRAVIGPEKYGIFPLKGKVLNIRDASVQQLMNNEEMNNIKQILGLQQGKVYKDTSELRYGKLIILTDSDVDGSHIKGLLINMIHAQWPSLIKMDFIQTLRTPIVKAIRGKTTIEFFTQQDYQKWKNTTPNTSGYQIKYFKGLGTSTKQDAQHTFKNIQSLMVHYFLQDKQCEQAILLAFDKDKNTKDKVKCSDKRKDWLGKYDKDVYLDIKQNKVSFNEFIHKDMIHFSIYDNLRSIPSLCDGLKPSQRKILYYMLKKNITKSIKVAQLSGYVSAETSYHHGEASLQQAIVGMAQDFVGSNNINLLFPDGNLGTRLAGGKDAASPRYIFTYLSQITPHIFHHYDTPLLNILEDDGEKIEPEWYVPVIPLVLVNGCEGIGTGFSTYIPPHNPKDIINNLKRKLNNKTFLPLHPFFKNYNGHIEDCGDGKYITRGNWERISKTEIKITELPINTWITPYKEFLESLVEQKNNKDKTKKCKNILKDVSNLTKDENTGIEFIVEFKSSQVLDDLINDQSIEKELKLIKHFSTNNMYLFDDKCTPSKYNTTLDILEHFYTIRLSYYVKRKEYLIQKFSAELEKLKAKVRFIDAYINGKLNINRKSLQDITTLLEQQKYPKYKSESEEMLSYNYLIKMPLVSLTLEKIQELEKQRDAKQLELDNIYDSTPEQLWSNDLDKICNLI
jgi:DNA topoisomerase-2